MEAQIKSLYEPLYQFVNRRVKDKEEAKDLTQEVFYKLSRSNIEELENLESWVYTIARNTIIDFYRRQKVVTAELIDPGSSESYDQEDVVAELSSCVSRFVEDLPEEYKTVIKLSDIEGVSQKEIAERLDMNYVTLRSKVQRGRKLLKQLFTECCAIEQGGKGSIMAYRERNKCIEKNECAEYKACSG